MKKKLRKRLVKHFKREGFIPGFISKITKSGLVGKHKGRRVIDLPSFFCSKHPKVFMFPSIDILKPPLIPSDITREVYRYIDHAGKYAEIRSLAVGFGDRPPVYYAYNLTHFYMHMHFLENYLSAAYPFKKEDLKRAVSIHHKKVNIYINVRIFSMVAFGKIKELGMFKPSPLMNLNDYTLEASIDLQPPNPVPTQTHEHNESSA